MTKAHLRDADTRAPHNLLCLWKHRYQYRADTKLIYDDYNMKSHPPIYLKRRLIVKLAVSESNVVSSQSANYAIQSLKV